LLITRIRSPLELLYLIGSSWLPALWLIVRLGGDKPLEAAVQFGLGYLAFISCYEIGYLANDCWDAARSKDGRQRLRFAPTPAYVLAYIAVRGGTWAAIAILTGWISEPIWTGGFAALILVFALHNVLRSASLRTASFLQLSMLRFTLPIVAVLGPDTYLVAFIAAAIFYTPLRLLSYLDSKNLLVMTDRRSGQFKLAFVAVGAPLALYLSVLTRSPVIAELLAYYVLFFAVIALRGSALRH
jgi:hypothetical protein